MTKRFLSIFSLFFLTTPLAACNDDGGTDAETNGTEVGDGDGDPTGDGDGDGDPTGDGDGDPTEGPDGAFCIHQCSADADCLVGGQDIGLTCQDSVCTSDAEGCTDNAQCIAQFSGWVTPCTSGGGECDALAQVCISEGLCATPPSDFVDCATLMMEEFETTDIDGNPVTVCANTSAECNPEGFCYVPCQADADCLSASAPVCNVGTGLCECGSDADCATLGAPANSVCNAGVCGCGTDQNCVDGSVGDVCNDGFCGCSGDMACEGVPNNFDGGMISCVDV